MVKYLYLVAILLLLIVAGCQESDQPVQVGSTQEAAISENVGFQGERPEYVPGELIVKATFNN